MDIIIARQHPHDPERLLWRRESADGAARLSEGGWAELAEACVQARLIWLAPTEDVLLTGVSIANRRELKRAAPYALEEELAEDLESLHFAFGNSEEGTVTPVAVVSRQTMDSWIDNLRDHGLHPQAVVPDALALPRQPEQFSVVLEGPRALVRTGENSGFAADAGTLAPLLTGAIETSKQPPRSIEIRRGPGATVDTPLAPLPLEEQHWDGHLLGIIPPGWGRSAPLNLLQGDFRATRPSRRHAPWWVAAALGAVWLVLSFTQDVLHHNELTTLKTEYQQAMRDLYFQTFPEARKAPDPRLLMEQRLADMRAAAGQVNSSGFITLLDTTAQVIADVQGTQVNALRYRDGRLDIELEAAGAEALDDIKQAVEAHGLKASLQSVDAQGDRVSGRIYVEPRS